MSLTTHIDDATFVRAPVGLVYRRITDVAAWPSWWSGLVVDPLPPESGDERWALSLRIGRARLLRLAITCERWRHEAGIVLRADGDLRGRVEFWLEPTHGGTVVHHLASVSTGSPWPSTVLRGYRRAVRRGLWGFKDVLQLELRTAIGMVP